jgi:hypothetical protein
MTSSGDEAKIQCANAENLTRRHEDTKEEDGRKEPA